MKDQGFSFAVSICTDDKTGAFIGAYFRVRKGKVSRVQEHADGSAFANYGKNGKLLGIEIIGPCEVKVLDRIAHEPSVRSFVKRNMPRELARAWPTASSSTAPPPPSSRSRSASSC